ETVRQFADLSPLREIPEQAIRAVGDAIHAGRELPLTLQLDSTRSIRTKTQLFYAIGTCQLDTSATVRAFRRPDGHVHVRLQLNHRLHDRYDWHAHCDVELSMGGSDARFPDTWGQLLVETGRAREFDISSQGRDVIDYVSNEPAETGPKTWQRK